MYGHGGFGLGFLNFLGTLLFFVALFWALRFFLSSRSRRWRGCSGRHQRERQDEAASTARERFARGEIGEDEFGRLRDTLKRTVRGERSPLEWFGGGDRALELARMRLARGELNAEEFETLRKALQS